MITRLILSWLLFLLLGQLGIAQPATNSPHRNQLQLSLGYHHNQSQDLVYSPMIYRGGSATALGLTYRRSTAKGLHQFRAAFDQTEVTSTDLISFEVGPQTRTRIPSQALYVSAAYGYAHNIISNNRLELFLGALLEARIHLTGYEFGVSDDDGYMIANTLNPWLRGTYQWSEKAQLEAEVYLPLLAWVSRPDYAIVDNEAIQHDGSDLSYLYPNGELTSWNAYRAINVSLFYNWRFSPGFQAGIGYRMDLQQMKNPLPINVLKSQVDLGFSFFF